VPTTPREPLPVLPDRRLGVRRRTSHVDIGPPEGQDPAWPRPLTDEEGKKPVGAVMVIRGAGRELLTTAGGSEVLDEAALEAGFDRTRRLVSLETTPAAGWTAGLLDQRSGSGFRRAVASSAPPEAGSLLLGLLDDLPAAVLISGYARMRNAERAGMDPASLTPPGVLPKMTDLCSGWRDGGVAVESIRIGRGVPMQDCPPSTDLAGADVEGWHVAPPLQPDWMRRRRCVDVEGLGDDRWTVWAMFRDTVAEPDGTEAVLHEYTVSMRLGPGPEGPVITALEAVPRVLPFPECPSAARQAEALCGLAIGALSTSVRETLTGVASCTHLNDLLRSVGGAVPPMIGVAVLRP
jgi:Protein of unknown function (DUF2889)